MTAVCRGQRWGAGLLRLGVEGILCPKEGNSHNPWEKEGLSGVGFR